MNRPRSLWYALLAAFLSSLLGSVAAIQYANHVQRAADQRWCTLLDLLTAPDSPPPQTPRAKEIYDAVQAQRRAFRC